ncbi:MAG: methyl-accepting chemotaxis protein, partial [Leptospirales bacterium]|nr:methyl-accepting chemotaxis protein [Leptospirales bacterium]
MKNLNIKNLNMRNLKISMKIMVVVTILTVMALVISLLGIIGMKALHKNAEDLCNRDLVTAIALSEMCIAFEQERSYFRDMFIYIDNPAIVKDGIENANRLHAVGDMAVQRYIAAMGDVPVEAPLMEAAALLSPPDGKYYVAKEKIVQSAAAGDAKGVLAGLEDAAVYRKTIENSFDELLKIRTVYGNEKVDEIASQFSRLVILVISVLIIVITFAIIFGRHISGIVSRPLIQLSIFMNKAGSTGDITLAPEDVEIINKYSQREDEIGQSIAGCVLFVEHVTNIAEKLDSVAKGDLTVEYEELSDEDTMGKSLKNMIDNLNSMFMGINNISAQVSINSKQIAETSSGIASGASQVAEGTQSLAEGATRQTMYMDELSSSVAAIAEKTKVNAGMTEQAAQLADQIIAKAEKGNRHMNEMIATVNDVTEASRSVNNIMETVNDIAEQTNLLSLNAAIEAARAGEQGKGFAVVAAEVGKLAIQSEQAVKEISSIIQASIQKA